MDVNKITLIGNVISDPKPAEGSAVRFPLATNREWRDEKSKARRQAVARHEILAFGRLGEIIAEYVRKGNKVYVEGRLDGATVVANNLILLTRKSRGA